MKRPFLFILASFGWLSGGIALFEFLESIFYGSFLGERQEVIYPRIELSTNGWKV